MYTPIEINCADFTVVDSGSFTHIASTTSRLRLHYQGEFIVINMRFFNDPGQPSRIEFRSDQTASDKTYAEGDIGFVNFNDRLGTSSGELIKLGQISGQSLHFTFKIEDLGDDFKLIFYTFYIRD